MKKIGIDARLYFQTGVGTYLRNYLYYLQQMAPSDIKFIIYLLEKDKKKAVFWHKNFVKKTVTSYWHSFSEQTRFLYDIYQDNPDLMHFTYFSYPVLYQKPFIATVHDLTPLFFKTGKASTKNIILYEIKHYIFRKVINLQINKALKIITPSETVKKQIINLYGDFLKEKIISVYEGIDVDLCKAKENFDLSKKFQKPFFLYVGNFYPHKNVETLIRAFSQIDSSYNLIMVGPKDYFSNYLKKIVLELKLDKRIIFFHKAKPSDLKFFYKNARALIHPSFSEGFGLPLVEAAYFNCPVIGSDIEIFRELLDDQYIPFNPNKINEIADKIRQAIITRPVFDYQKIIKQYSFRKMTKATLEIYKKLLALS